MGSPIQSIEAAFATSLAELATAQSKSVAWPNAPFAPTTGTAYIKADNLPGEPFQAELGTDGLNYHSGIYQITVVYPAGVGTASPGALRDAVINAFKRGTVLSYSGVYVTVTRAYASPMMIDADWVRIPVNIEYRVFASN